MRPKRLKAEKNTEKMVMISMRMPRRMLDALKRTAAIRQKPYQTLLKQWLEEKLRSASPER